LDGGRRGVKLHRFSQHVTFVKDVTSVSVDDDLGMSQSDHIAVSQLPLLDWRIVNGGAVGGVEVRQQRNLTVPANLQMTP